MAKTRRRSVERFRAPVRPGFRSSRSVLGFPLCSHRFLSSKIPSDWRISRPGLLSWLQDAGGFAAVGLLFWLIYQAVRRRRTTSDEPRPTWHWIFLLALLGSFGCYAVLLVAKMPEYLEVLLPTEGATEPAKPLLNEVTQTRILAVAGGLALLAVGIMPFMNLFALRFRRIWALARLSLKDAIRRRVLWVFLIVLLLMFFFVGWFIDAKPENQVRSYVQVLYWIQTPLLIVTASLLAAMSIPYDIRQQTIHTIITKPVERYEIVLGQHPGLRRAGNGRPPGDDRLQFAVHAARDSSRSAQ